MRTVKFSYGGTSYCSDGVWEFRTGFRTVFDDDNNVVFDEFVEERVKVSECEQEPSGDIVDYS